MIDRQKLRKISDLLSEASASLDVLTQDNDGGVYDRLHEAYIEAYGALVKVDLVRAELLLGIVIPDRVQINPDVG